MDSTLLNYAAEYEAKCEAEDEEYQDFIRGKCCRDCQNCYEPEEYGFDNPTEIGFCIENREFVGLNDLVTDIECQTFE
jgi:hypothetical protein